jgi:hypothetical protein
MIAFQAGVLSGAIAQVQALEADQAALEQDWPRAAPLPPAATAEDFAGFDLDRRRALVEMVVETVVETVVVRRAERRGAPWTPDRLERVQADSPRSAASAGSKGAASAQ